MQSRIRPRSYNAGGSTTVTSFQEAETLSASFKDGLPEILTLELQRQVPAESESATWEKENSVNNRPRGGLVYVH